MAAGQGFKTFANGEVLSAADVNGYLMQGVLVFADATARTAAITSPQEGQTTYLKDTDVIQVYSGSAWVTKSGALPTQTGNAGKYLTTDGTDASWGTVSAGGMTLLSTTTLSGTSTTISSISQSYKSLYFIIHSVNAASNYIIQCLPNNSSTLASAGGYDTSSAAGYAGQAIRISGVNNTLLSSSTQNAYACRIDNYASTTSLKPISHYGMGASGVYVNFAGCFRSTTEITSLVFNLDGTTFTGGTVLLYGVS